ncbi:acireductone synthase [Microbacterium enclense]|uniref:acireductone synthase n=1 Tax=Microbacterium enclense TaxID=993073 RepID=UPI002040E7BF|nr:acireductone synthase [Microbacterium enclense]MCM3615530.1 acireductone synthase [Microbacterium enclense]
MTRIVITAPFDPRIAAELPGEVVTASEAETGQSLGARAAADPVFAAALAEADVVIAELDRIDDDALAAAPRLSLVVACRANPANVDLAACAARGVEVRTTPGRNADVTADFTLALLLATVRHVPAASAWLRAGNWSGDDVFEPYARFRGIGLSGRQLGVVGGGAVGRRVVRRAQGFGMRIAVYDPFLTPGALGDDVQHLELDDLLATSDIVTLHVPLTPETTGLIAARELALLRPDAYLVNAGRAALVDRDALLAVLREGRIAGAGFDVFHDEPLSPDDELLRLPNVTLTPHIAGASDDVVVEHSRLAAAAVASVFPPPSSPSPSPHSAEVREATAPDAESRAQAATHRDASTPDPHEREHHVTATATADVVVLDIEGTTSAAGFILGDLYDYARPRLDEVLGRDDDTVRAARADAIAETGLDADASDAEIAEALRGLMAKDVKSTPLKTLQGIIWAEGFAAGEIHSQFFDDVPPRLHAWHEDGIRLAVYSSGSVASQVPWFRHAPQGDLTPLVEDFFDTVKAGPKKESASFDKIAAALGVAPDRALFLTDHPDEVSAALAAGWQVVALDRAGEPWAGADFAAPAVASFDEVEVTR